MLYYIKRNGTQFGPFTKNEIQLLLNRGCLFVTDLAAPEEDPNFRSLLELKFKTEDIIDQKIAYPSNSYSIYKTTFLSKSYVLYRSRANFWICLTALFLFVLNFLGVISFDNHIQINLAAIDQYQYIVTYLFVITILTIINGASTLEKGLNFYITDLFISSNKKIFKFSLAICILLLPLFIIYLTNPSFFINLNLYKVIIIYFSLIIRLVPLPIFAITEKLPLLNYLPLTWKTTRGKSLKMILLISCLTIITKLAYSLVTLVFKYEISRGYGKIPLTIMTFIIFLQLIIFAIISFTVYCIELKN